MSGGVEFRVWAVLHLIAACVAWRWLRFQLGPDWGFFRRRAATNIDMLSHGLSLA